MASNKPNPIIKDLSKFFKVFRKFIPIKKIYFFLFINILRSFTDGVGFVLFLPLLSMDATLAEESTASGVSIFLNNIIQSIGLNPTFSIILIMIVIIFLIKGVIVLFQGFYESHIFAYFTRKVRKLIVSSLMRVDYQFYIKNNTGFYNNLVTTEVDRTRSAFGHFISFISTIVNVAFYTGLSFMISPRFTGMAMVMGLIVFFCLKFITKLSKKYSHHLTESNESITISFIQAIQAFKYFLSTNGFKKFFPKLNEGIQVNADLQYKTGKLSAFLKAVTEPLVIICVGILLFLHVVIFKEPLSAILITVLLFYRVMTSMVHIQILLQNIFLMSGSVNRVNQTYEMIDLHQEKYGKIKIKNQFESIIFQNVSFSYGEKYVLKNLSLELPANKMISMVGKSGSGKSTFVDLITGVLKPTTGIIEINGIDSLEIDFQDFRNKICYVTQDPIVFDDTIANNICLWACDPSDETCFSKIENAAKIANCESFIIKKPDSYKSIVGDRGVNLSGGQKQRLVIAREIFKQPNILILDEATSALDSESEKLIQLSIDNLKGKLTIIIIAHRLSTIKNCDIIFVLENGSIIEKGTFEELYKKNEAFKMMCKMQSL